MAERKHALLVRLDEAGRDRVAAYLSQNGWDVVALDNGRDAVARLREVPADLPDLVVTDGVLPKITGFELCRQVKALLGGKAVPVVMLLEDNDSYGRGRARVEGADLILTEPMLDEDLAEILTVTAGQHENVQAILSRSGGSRDRFVSSLLRDANGGDGFVNRITDPLTGLLHKGYSAFKLEEEFKKARRYGMPLALILVEVDNFAEAVTTHGKSIGKEMLLEVAGIFLCESRDVDTAGRVDEARFMLLLPHTDLDGARTMADRVFQQVCARKVVVHGNDVPIRASVGIVALPNDDVATVDEFVERALRGLRTARNMGGNRICAWADR